METRDSLEVDPKLWADFLAELHGLAATQGILVAAEFLVSVYATGLRSRCVPPERDIDTCKRAAKMG